MSEALHPIPAQAGRSDLPCGFLHCQEHACGRNLTSLAAVKTAIDVRRNCKGKTFQQTLARILQNAKMIGLSGGCEGPADGRTFFAR